MSVTPRPRHFDEPVTAVLETYHRWMAEERDLPREGAPGAARHGHRLLAVGPETGRLLNSLARSRAAPTILEIGTSYGYSGIWLGEAARARGGRLITMEIDPEKSAVAREMAERAGLADHVDFLVGDALALIPALPGKLDMVLLDLWKDLYLPCLEAFLPKLNPGAIVVADNMTRPGGEAVARYARAVRAAPGMTSGLVPIGSGLEISRYEP